jgi:signal transduction histidine kinase
MRRYVLASAPVIAAVVLRWPLQPVLATQYAYLLFYPAVVVSALVGGFGAGVWATLLSAAAAQYLYVAPGGVLWPQTAGDAVAMLVFIASGAGVALLTEQRQRFAEERTASAERAERARADAEKANRLKDDFLMILSHELRTPLNALWGWARMLRTGELSMARREHALEVIERNARAQLHLVEDLLDVSQIRTGKLRLERVRVDLPEIVEAAVDEVRLSAESKQVGLDIRRDASVPPVEADPGRLQQAFANLLTNAVKFTPPGGQIVVAAERRDGVLEVTVRDNGVGIATEMLPVIFDPFRQADSGTTRSFAGLGIGLSIARSLVEAHGGTLTARSDGLGRGAEFRVSLPLHSA